MQTSEHFHSGEKIAPKRIARIDPFGCPVGMSKKSQSSLSIGVVTGNQE
jgi:hypothetical protein